MRQLQQSDQTVVVADWHPQKPVQLFTQRRIKFNPVKMVPYVELKYIFFKHGHQGISFCLNEKFIQIVSKAHANNFGIISSTLFFWRSSYL